jgi:16S rRNA (cytidine1402-2'-O)-methyltransferase
MTAAEQPVGRLIVCPTPIGNLGDVTLRVLAALGEADAVACEDTRHTRVLLERYGLTAPLVSFHEHNEAARARELVARIREGAVVALVSDAGTPLLSDPGFALVRLCIAEDLQVEVLPGPTAVVTALVASGLPPERWMFVGFLPRKRAELADLLMSASVTLVGFESPRRLVGTLRLLASGDPERPLAVCRELSKLHEEVRRGSASELLAHYESAAGRGPVSKGRECGDGGAEHASPTGSLRGEIVLVIGAAPSAEVQRARALQALREVLQAGAKARPAAAAIAKLTGLRANELYRELNREGQ